MSYNKLTFTDNGRLIATVITTFHRHKIILTVYTVGLNSKVKKSLKGVDFSSIEFPTMDFHVNLALLHVNLVLLYTSTLC